MTHAFLEAYLHQLKGLRSPYQIELLYSWLWERQAEVKSAIEHMNKELGLTEDLQLRPALPVFCVGSAEARLRIIGVNPAYRGSAALAADRYCRGSVQNYLQYTLGYFCPDLDLKGLGQSGGLKRSIFSDCFRSMSACQRSSSLLMNDGGLHAKTTSWAAGTSSPSGRLGTA